jgi:hypothetical protein
VSRELCLKLSLKRQRVAEAGTPPTVTVTLLVAEPPFPSVTVTVAV